MTLSSSNKDKKITDISTSYTFSGKKNIDIMSNLAIVNSATILLPLFQSTVSAGFPSPADDYIERYLDLNQLLIQNPSSTFLARARGDSMLEIGIHCGDILIVDRALEAQHKDIVVAALDGELVCKILDKHNQCLLPANQNYPAIPVNSLSEFIVEGVVISSIRCHRLVNEFEEVREDK
jgi:DNA polymerase V